MDPERIKKIRLMDLEFRALHSKLFEEMFFKKIAASKNAELKELSKNQPAALMIIGLEKEIMPSTIGIYMGMDRSSLLKKKGLSGEITTLKTAGKSSFP